MIINFIRNYPWILSTQLMTLGHKFARLPITFMDHSISFNSSTITMSETTLDHTNIVCTILMIASAITICLTIKVLTFLDCVIICDHSYDTVWLVSSFPKLSDNPSIIKDFFRDIGFLRIEVNWLITMLKNLLNSQGLEFLPIL